MIELGESYFENPIQAARALGGHKTWFGSRRKDLENACAAFTKARNEDRPGIRFAKEIYAKEITLDDRADKILNTYMYLLEKAADEESGKGVEAKAAEFLKDYEVTNEMIRITLEGF